MRFVEHDKKNSAEIVLCSYTQHYAQMPRCKNNIQFIYR